MQIDPALGPDLELASRHLSETEQATSKQKPFKRAGFRGCCELYKPSNIWFAACEADGELRKASADRAECLGNVSAPDGDFCAIWFTK
jgi:hypothetical protein